MLCLVTAHCQLKFGMSIGVSLQIKGVAITVLHSLALIPHIIWLRQMDVFCGTLANADRCDESANLRSGFGLIDATSFGRVTVK